jgi:hypothetical protein
LPEGHRGGYGMQMAHVALDGAAVENRGGARSMWQRRRTPQAHSLKDLVLHAAVRRRTHLERAFL